MNLERRKNVNRESLQPRKTGRNGFPGTPGATRDDNLFLRASQPRPVLPVLRLLSSWTVFCKTFDAIDEQHYATENTLLRQIESLQAKQKQEDWDDNLFLREDEVTYLLNQID